MLSLPPSSAPTCQPESLECLGIGIRRALSDVTSSNRSDPVFCNPKPSSFRWGPLTTSARVAWQWRTNGLSGSFMTGQSVRTFPTVKGKPCPV